ncbi:protein O-mannosyl-transferase TMTC2-like [Schistocerca piceifrons]|uniref:protein O-mannosyl-transferase TMTC2-like n=1 Tax=Schistocerca piceifrons TaxID=274613 RepID=UPI001F5F177E|nr:protein O-mannosyl-transferase TMTC2-like [Schistocerca piceifrons]
MEVATHNVTIGAQVETPVSPPTTPDLSHHDAIPMDIGQTHGTGAWADDIEEGVQPAGRRALRVASVVAAPMRAATRGTAAPPPASKPAASASSRVDWACVASAALAALLYAGTLRAGFVYDDNRAILTNEDVVGGGAEWWWRVWRHDFWGTPLQHAGSHGSYRPLAVLSFRLDAALWRLRPAGFHLSNVALHAAATAAVVRWARALLAADATGPGDGAAPWAAGLLFAAHPVHTEAVAGLVGRADEGAALLLLLALLLHEAHCRRRRAAPPGAWRGRLLLSLCVLVSGCAMLAKEHGVCALAICLVREALAWQRAAGDPRARRQAVRSACWLAAGLSALVAARLCAAGGRVPRFAAADNPAARHPSRLTRALTFLLLPALHAWLLLCPATLSFDWSMDAVPLVHSPADPRNAASAALYACVAGAVLLAARRSVRAAAAADRRHCKPPAVCIDHNANHSVAAACHHSTQHRSESGLGRGATLVAVSLSATVLPFVPASNLVAHVGFVVAERVLYVPSAGYCVLAGYGFARLLHASDRRAWRWSVTGCACVLLVLMSARTLRRCEDWMDEESLYRSGLHVNPPKAYGNLGNILSMKGELEEAERCYRKALSYRPNMADVHYNLGVLLQSQQRLEEAAQSYQTAISFRPSLAAAYLNLGLVLWRLGREADALGVLRAGAAADGSALKDPRAHAQAATACRFHLGRLLLESGRAAAAERELRAAVAGMPPHYQPQSLFNLLGEAQARLGRHAEAERWFQESLRAKPDHVPAHLTYGRLLARNSSRAAEAEQWYRRALRLAPDDASVLLHYGQFLLSQQRPAEAAAALTRAASLSPEALAYEDAMNAAASLRLAGDLRAAETFYRMAVSMRPTEPAGVGNLGALYHLMGRHAEAEKFYREALRLLPGDPVTLANLRRLHRRMAAGT